MSAVSVTLAANDQDKPANPAEPLEDDQASPGHQPRVRRHEQGPAQPRLQLRRLDDLLRLHAGGGAGERSSGGVLPASNVAGSSQWRSDMVKQAKNTICLWYDG